MQDIGDHYDGGRRIFLVLAAIFMVVVVGGVIDLILDRPTTLFTLHVAFEVLMVCVSLSAAAYLAWRWHTTEAMLVETERASEQLAEERRSWEERSAVLIQGLGEAISTQFDAWALTETEGRVALMLLKGLSHKGIAKRTGTSERTVRQHAVAVYRKSGLAGRAELAGFFLEDLLLPRDAEAQRP